MGSTRLLGTGGRGAFPPNIIVGIKALACELPHELGIPLSRFSMSELKRAAIQRGIVASIGEATIWRWLSADALKPWNHRTWVFPRAPDFEVKAARILDLYEGPYEGDQGRGDYLYGKKALAASRAALKPAGVFAVWSEDPDAAFEKRLQAAGFSVNRQRPGRGGRRHVVYIAGKTDK